MEEIVKPAFWGSFLPQRLFLREDGLELRYWQNLWRRTTQSASYSQIAQVRIESGWVYANLKIETTGGDELVLTGTSKRHAAHAAAVISQRMSEARAGERT